ncbi:MAG: hypothetical protein DWQ34_07745 [Planctomycetota bacterium]|nr:MAG: hypothetical protein DWQ29_24490 [Planctomycetota bacterium]REJ94780.1 MAG: hypothetical protein DWQ34_07745 [Planctomycetota bacterium]REK21462.1 MAG: hypothetical protein DWQ41_21770 [Planctomycetota bacterium]REK40026.1 MAG: hypothetical protein DWQ45_00275 [Planctomycetota bacterium]
MSLRDPAGIEAGRAATWAFMRLASGLLRLRRPGSENRGHPALSLAGAIVSNEFANAHARFGRRAE